MRLGLACAEHVKLLSCCKGAILFSGQASPRRCRSAFLSGITESWAIPIARRQYSSSKLNPLPKTAIRAGCTALPSRSLLLLYGHDAASFLQGLTTANIPMGPSLPTDGNDDLPAAIYSAFLNAQGRLMQDVFIYPLSPAAPVIGEVVKEVPDCLDDSILFIIETDESQVKLLSKWLQRYKLRAKVKFHLLDSSKLGVYFSWDDSSTGASPDLLKELHKTGAYLASDIRSPSFGTRIIAPTSSSTLLSAASSSALDYKLRRYLHCLPEGPLELPPANTLVHDSSIDKANAVDFRKGCYVGQELVIRTQHTGVVRKRMLPVVLYHPGEQPPSALVDAYRPLEADLEPGVEIEREGEDTGAADESNGKLKKARSLGRFVAGIGNVGLASVRLEPMLGIGPGGERIEGWTEAKFQTRSQGKHSKSWQIKAFLPHWW